MQIRMRGKLLQYEIRKLWMQKRLLVCLLFFLVLSVLEVERVLYLPNAEGNSIKEMAAAYCFLPDDSLQMQLQWLEKQLLMQQEEADELAEQELMQQEEADELAEQELMQQEEADGSAEQEFVLQEEADGSAEQLYRQIACYQHLNTQAEAIASYPAYLQQVKKQADKMANSLWGGQASGFIKQNAQVTAEVYTDLGNVIPQFVFLDGIACVLSDQTADGLLWLMVLLIALSCFHRDEAEGREVLLKTTKGGKQSLDFTKYLAVACVAGLLLLLQMGIRVGSVLPITPTESWLVPIQSIPGYLESPWKLSVWQYIFCYIAGKWMALLVWESLIFFLAQLFKNPVFSGFGVLLVGWIEFSLWNILERQSVYGFWKQFNFVSILDTAQYFKTYWNLNAWGKPLNQVVIGGSFALLVGGIGFAGGLLFGKCRRTGSRKRRSVLFDRKKEKHLILPQRIFYYEWKKLWWIHKGGIFLLLFLVVQILVLQGRFLYFDETTYFYRLYSQELTGVSTSEQEAFLKAEQNKQREKETRLESYRTQYEAGTISYETLLRYETLLEPNEEKEHAFERVMRQYEALKELQKEGIEAEYVDLSTWEFFFGEDGRWLVLSQLLQSLAVLAVPLWSYSRYERRHHMKEILFVSGGNRRVRNAQYAVVLLFAGSGVLVSILPFAGYVLGKYGWSGWDAPAASLLFGTFAKLPLSIGGAFLCLQGIQIALVLGAAILFFTLQQKTE